ncbi:MAG TPA: hypothetical protein VEC19_15095 [Usitatibacter sp.]|nr:hypothetical protein [Usitatibacter sp.]
MGIKDLMGGMKDLNSIKEMFGGGEKAKKKEQLREAVKDAVQDGKLSNSDMIEIKALQAELDVTPAADDRTQQRREIYNAAVDAVKKDGNMSATGVHELAKIQKFLALRDDQVEKTKFQVTRLRTLTEIKKGNLPVVPDSSVALRDVALEEGEVAHYTMGVDILDQPSTRQADGIAIVFGQPHPDNEAAGHALPEAGAKEMGEATLIITNRRLVLKTRGRVAAVKLGPEARLFLYSDGLRLARTVGNTLLRFRSRSDETAEIVGTLLAALMR